MNSKTTLHRLAALALAVTLGATGAMVAAVGFDGSVQAASARPTMTMTARVRWAVEAMDAMTPRVDGTRQESTNGM